MVDMRIVIRNKIFKLKAIYKKRKNTKIDIVFFNFLSKTTENSAAGKVPVQQ